MKKVILLNKKEGETPLATLERFRKKNKAYKAVSLTYAGRLDPLATGLLLVLAGDETKNKEKYLDLEKEYKFEVLFGFSTDTYDILGKVTDDIGKVFANKKELRLAIIENIKNFTGKFSQKYPMYSSKTVAGIPLYKYARLGVDIEVPTREVYIKNFKLLSIRKMNKKRLFSNIERRINKVVGDFRQKEIIKIWERKLKAKRASEKYFIAGFKINCSTGTYVRGIANSLGEAIGTPALAFSIKRTKIGKWQE